MKTLAERVTDPEWIKEKTDEDAYFEIDRVYHLPGIHLRDNVLCSMEHCEMDKRTPFLKFVKELNKQGKMEEKPVYHPMKFCFACNRTFHLKCLGLSLEESIKVPWICQECIQNPINVFTVEFSKGKLLN